MQFAYLKKVRQLPRISTNCYSPIAGCRKRIRAKSELRKKISGAAGDSWQELCARYDAAQQIMHNPEELFAPYKSIIEYDNQQLRDELIPLYRKMLDVFTEKYWLADEDTRAHYQDFLEFVEIWERFLAEALPGEVVRNLGHTEDNLRPFYEHIEQKLSALQKGSKGSALLEPTHLISPTRRSRDAARYKSGKRPRTSAGPKEFVLWTILVTEKTVHGRESRKPSLLLRGQALWRLYKDLLLWGRSVLPILIRALTVESRLETTSTLCLWF